MKKRSGREFTGDKRDSESTSEKRFSWAFEDCAHHKQSPNGLFCTPFCTPQDTHGYDFLDAGGAFRRLT